MAPVLMSDHEPEEPPDWHKPLGRGLPPLGPGRSRWPVYLLAAALLCCGVYWAGAALYWCWFPPPTLAVRLESVAHTHLRGAALAWRSFRARNPDYAEALEIWKVALEAEQAAEGQPLVQWLLVQPASAGQSDGVAAWSRDALAKLETLRSVDSLQGAVEVQEDENFFCQLCRRQQAHLYEVPAERWSPSLMQLSPETEQGTLGRGEEAERLSRGTVLVHLAGPRARLVASSRSPESGHIDSSISLVRFAGGCLPQLSNREENGERTFADAAPLLANPKRAAGAAAGAAASTWLARGGEEGRRLWVFQASACGQGPSNPLAAASVQISKKSLPQLTEYHSSRPNQSFLLLHQKGNRGAPELLSYERNGSLGSLRRVGAITTAGVGALGDAAAASSTFPGGLRDSFDTRIKQCAEKDPPVPARYVAKGAKGDANIRYLVPESGPGGNRWTFRECAKPDAARYERLRAVDCDDPGRNAEFSKPELFLTPEQIKACKREAPWKGCTVDLGGCRARVEAAPCAPCPTP